MEYQQLALVVSSCNILGGENISYPIKDITTEYPPEPYYTGEVFVRIHDYIPEVLDLYWISNYGRVYCFKSHKFKKIVYDDRNATDNYYVRVALRTSLSNDSKYYSVHRLIMVCFNPNTYGIHQLSMQVNHKDGNKSNNYYNLFNQNRSNLEWQSASDNVRHAFNNGLNSQVGQMNSSAKLNEKQVLDIISMLPTHTDKEIASIIGYDCTYNMVHDIRVGNTWTYLRFDSNRAKENNNRIFTDEEVHNFCRYFSENKELFKHKTVVQLCRETLAFYNYQITNENILELRLIKLVYKHITTTYDY